MSLERLRKDLARARQNALQWQARAKDIERRITETENQEIIRAVREIVVTPEELTQVLASIRAMKQPSVGTEKERIEEEKEDEK